MATKTRAAFEVLGCAIARICLLGSGCNRATVGGAFVEARCLPPFSQVLRSAFSVVLGAVLTHLDQRFHVLGGPCCVCNWPTAGLGCVRTCCAAVVISVAVLLANRPPRNEQGRSSHIFRFQAATSYRLQPCLLKEHSMARAASHKSEGGCLLSLLKLFSDDSS